MDEFYFSLKNHVLYDLEDSDESMNSNALIAFKKEFCPSFTDEDYLSIVKDRCNADYGVRRNVVAASYRDLSGSLKGNEQLAGLFICHELHQALVPDYPYFAWEKVQFEVISPEESDIGIHQKIFCESKRSPGFLKTFFKNPGAYIVEMHGENLTDGIWFKLNGT